MRSARRRQRHQSEPLPERPSQESPDPDTDNDLAASHQDPQFPLDPQLEQTSQKRSGVAFPLTPTSAAGEAERAMATASGTTNDRCTPSDGEQLRASETTSPVKMSHHASINDSSIHPPPSDVPVNDPSSADNVRVSSTHANGSSSSSSAFRAMSHRVENVPIRPRHFQDPHFHDTHAGHYYSTHPSPPPITSLTHSPSLSSDRSSVSSPAPTILPPLAHPGQIQTQHYLSSSAHRYPSATQPTYHHSHYYPSTVAPPDVFATPVQPYAHSYAGSYAPPPAHVPFHHTTDMSFSSSQQYAAGSYATVGPMYSHGGHGGGGSGGFTPIYTDDASTKLSDRVRRRCFNCCTTDTSTWRRSSLNPGKVLCNKCGLFERTHSRPRPDQFPHKRAPLQIPTHNSGHEAGQASSASSHAQSQAQAQQPHSLPPTTTHPSLGAAYNHPSALPQIQEWLRPGAAPIAGSPSSSGSAGPSSRAASASSAVDRHPRGGTSGADTRSPQGLSARLQKRSDSVTSDMLGTPPRPAQNLTPSPSPPPETARPSGVMGTATGSPRMSHGPGTDTGKP